MQMTRGGHNHLTESGSRVPLRVSQGPLQFGHGDSFRLVIFPHLLLQHLSAILANNSRRRWLGVYHNLFWFVFGPVQAVRLLPVKNRDPTDRCKKRLFAVGALLVIQFILFTQVAVILAHFKPLLAVWTL